jgi:hypothetical protein
MQVCRGKYLTIEAAFQSTQVAHVDAIITISVKLKMLLFFQAVQLMPPYRTAIDLTYPLEKAKTTRKVVKEVENPCLLAHTLYYYE